MILSKVYWGDGMTELIQSGKISELKNSQNIAYILEEPALFNLTGYKVLMSQERNGFIKCAKVLHNGKIKLLYFTSGHKNLKNMMPLIDTDTFVIVISNLLKAVIDIKNNGFLSCQNLDLSFEKVFVDQHTFEVSLIYLPIQDDSIDELEFENNLKTNLIKVIASTPSLTNTKMNRISSLLSNGSLSLRELYNALKSESSGKVYKVTPPNTDEKKIIPNQSGQPALKFISLDANHPIKLTVTTPEYIIGKNPAKVNGVIDFNKAIGRVHCRFVYQNGQYFIIDGDGTKCSTNGTYVNGSKLSNMQPCAIKNGDRIQLANSDFAIQI